MNLENEEDNFNSFNSGTTLPDYINFRNILFQQWQELNNSSVEVRTTRTNLRVYLSRFTTRVLSSIA